MHQRNVRKVVRDNHGFFYLLGAYAIQRWDGKDFEYINHSAIEYAGLELDDIEEMYRLKGGLLLLISNQAKKHFALVPGETAIKPIDIKGRVFVSDRKLYSTVATNGSFITTRYKVSKTLKIKETTEAYTSDFEPLTVLPRTSGAIMMQKDSTVLIAGEGKSVNLGVNGSAILCNDKIYVWTRNAVYRLDGQLLQKVANLPSITNQKLSILKTDFSGNMIAAYSSRPRFNEHLYVLDEKEQLRSLPQVIDRNRGLFRDFHTDNADYQWMFAGYNAVGICKFLRDGCDHIFAREGVKKNSFSNVISGLATDGDDIYFLKESKGIYVVDTSEPKGYRLLFPDADYERHFKNNGKLTYSRQDSLFYSYQFLYEGNSILVELDARNRTWQEKKVPFKLNDLLPLGNKNVLLGGHDKTSQDGIVAVYDFQKATIAYPLETEIKKVRCVYWHTTTQTYWIGTVRGLHVLDADFKEIAVFNSTSEVAAGRYLAHPDVIMTNAYRDVLVAGSLGGAYVIDPVKLIVLKTLSDNKEMSNGQVVGIMPDDDGYCWLTTFNGINVMDQHYNIVQQIYDHQGLSHREFNSKAICKDGHGNIYGGTLNGVTKITPETVRKWEESTGFYISQIKNYKGKGTEEIAIEDNYLCAYKSIDSVEIHYTRPSYFEFPFLRDGTSFSTTDSSIVAISNHPGKAVLKDLRTGTFDLLIEDRPTGLLQQIQGEIKYDYTYMLMLVTCLILLAFIVFLTYSYNKRKLIEGSMLNERIAELQLNALQSQMNPHFIFNALGAIQYFIQTHDVDRADEYLSNFAMLMRRILDSSKTRYVPLRQEIETLKLYVGLESVRFEKLFDYEFIMHDQLDGDLHVPPMVLQPYLENAINHGLYNLKGKEGHLTVAFSEIGNNGVQVAIEDNGVGRKRAAELRTKRHKSRGMKIIKDRIDTINSLKDMHVDVVVDDLYEGESASGTRVTVSFLELED